jgi:hypothetical protein
MDLALEVFPPLREKVDHGTFPYALVLPGFIVAVTTNVCAPK